MPRTKQPDHRFAPLTTHVKGVAIRLMNILNDIAADRALAQRAATMASLPRQRLGQLRALYTTQERALTTTAVTKGAPPRVFESSEFLPPYEEKRAA